MGRVTTKVVGKKPVATSTKVPVRKRAAPPAKAAAPDPPVVKGSAAKKQVAKKAPATPKKVVGKKARAAPTVPEAQEPARRNVAPAPDGEDALWAVIERVAAAVRAEGSQNHLEASCRCFRAELEALDAPTLVAVEAAFSSAMVRASDPRVYDAAYLIHGGCGDDTFWDFRAGLVAMGRRVYEAALAAPDSLAEVEDVENRTLFEGFQYEPGNVLEARGIASVGVAHGPGHVRVKTSNEPLWHDPAALHAALPKLAAQFGGRRTRGR